MPLIKERKQIKMFNFIFYFNYATHATIRSQFLPSHTILYLTDLGTAIKTRIISDIVCA